MDKTDKFTNQLTEWQDSVIDLRYVMATLDKYAEGGDGYNKDYTVRHDRDNDKYAVFTLGGSTTTDKENKESHYISQFVIKANKDLTRI